MLYFDHSATSIEKAKGVSEALVSALAYGNPGRSGYGAAIAGSECLLDARLAAAKLVSCSSVERIIFTSGASMSLNMAIRGLCNENKKTFFATGSYEHNSVTRPLQYLQKQGLVDWQVVQGEGDAFLENLTNLLKREQVDNLVLNHISNVTGSRMPIEEIYALCNKNHTVFVLDAAQSLGCERLSLEGADVICGSGHKGLRGPMGSGLLIFKNSVEIKPLIFGGTGSASESFEAPSEYPDRLEVGTPNLPGIAGLCAAIEKLNQEDLEKKKNKLQMNRDHLFLSLLELENKVKVYGPQLGGTALSISVPGHDLGEVTHQLWKKHEICVRVGLHCSPLAHQSLGTFPEGTIRISLAAETKKEEIDVLIAALKTVI